MDWSKTQREYIMPLVLTQNEATESGHTYADVLGIVYEYPRRYASLVQTGEQFVYYRGRRRATGGTQPQVYLGTGVVGTIARSEAVSFTAQSSPTGRSSPRSPSS